MEIAHLVKKRATCHGARWRGHREGQEHLATGYNGTPSGIEHCLDGAASANSSASLGRTPRESAGACTPSRTHHPGGQARHEHPGSTLYCTNQPCSICAKMIINAGAWSGSSSRTATPISSPRR